MKDYENALKYMNKAVEIESKNAAYVDMKIFVVLNSAA